jgi:hypothetical protein
MTVEIWTEAAQFPEKEYIYGIFLAVCTGDTVLGQIREMTGGTQTLPWWLGEQGK